MSHRTRPAATDYFNPAEQIDILQNIKARVGKSTTSTPQPQDNPLPQSNTSSDSEKIPDRPVTSKPVDLKTHELSLREKLEKAKADRQAKAKAEAAQKTTTTDSPQEQTNDTSSTEPNNGLPPPPILNTSTPTPVPALPFSQTWGSNVTYPVVPPMSNFRTPYSQYQPMFQPFAMQPYGNGLPAIQAYPTPQAGQFYVPPQSNQSAPAQGTPNQGTSQGPLPASLLQNQNVTSQMPPSQTPTNQVVTNQAATALRQGIVPPFGAQASFMSQPQVGQSSVPPRPGMPQASPSQTPPSQAPVSVLPQQVQPTPAQAPNNNNASTQNALVFQQSQVPPTAAPKGPAGSIYNSNPPAPRGPPKISQSNTEQEFSRPPPTNQTAQGTNNSTLPYPQDPPRESPRNRPPSPRQQPRRYDESPNYQRTGPQLGSTDNNHEAYLPSPQTRQPVARYPEQVDYAPSNDPPRKNLPPRIPTPPSRITYRDRSRSPPHRMPSPDSKRPRPTIPEEGYKRENWDSNRGGYKYIPPHLPIQYSPEGRRYSSPSPPPRRGSPPRFPIPPRRDIDDPYFRGPPGTRPREYPPRHEDYRGPPPGRPRSRSPPYRVGYAVSSSMPREYPPGRGHYDFPSPREPYTRDTGYPRHSPPPLPTYNERRGGYDDYYGPPTSGPDFPERDYGRGYERGPPPPDVYDAGYREFRDVRDREVLGPPPARPYSPGRSRPRGMSRGGGRY